VKTIERREGILPGWHREWTWISSTRHGAPTCSLNPKGQVRGVFLRLNPVTAKQDLEQFRQRERRETEQTTADIPDVDAKTHFWTMGNNLDRFPEFNDLGDDQLAKALAERAKRISQPGHDGVLASDYIRRVHEFDPNDVLTTGIVRHL
jgi:cation transport regulator ChaC